MFFGRQGWALLENVQFLFPNVMFQVNEDVSKTLQATKTLLYGTADQEPATEQVAMLSTEMYQSSMLQLLIQNLARIDFEVSKK